MTALAPRRAVNFFCPPPLLVHHLEVPIAKPNKATQTKRNRERSQQERKQEKDEKRAQRKELKKDRAALLAEGIDPDLMDIIPGPQPPMED